MRPIPDLAVDFIARHEGKRLTAYQDQVGVWTIGYGHTGGVEPGSKITLAEARALLKADMSIAGARIARKIGPVVNELTEHQYAALLSFVFNLGSGNPKKPEWNIWRRLRARDFDGVPQEFAKFVNAGGRKLQGLVNRRAEETKLWSTDEPGSTTESLPSSVTREIATPPTVSDPVSPGKSATIITAVTGVAATVPVAVQQVTQAVEPYKDASPLVGQVIGILATLAAAAAVLVLVLAWLKKREDRS